MEMFCFGTLAGMVFALLWILTWKLIDSKCEDTTEEIDEGKEALEQLCSDLNTMKLIIGLCDHEKETLSKAIAYIEKRGLNDDGVECDIPGSAES